MCVWAKVHSSGHLKLADFDLAMRIEYTDGTPRNSLEKNRFSVDAERYSTEKQPAAQRPSGDPQIKPLPQPMPTPPKKESGCFSCFSSYALPHRQMLWTRWLSFFCTVVQ